MSKRTKPDLSDWDNPGIRLKYMEDDSYPNAWKDSLIVLGQVFAIIGLVLLVGFIIYVWR